MDQQQLYTDDGKLGAQITSQGQQDIGGRLGLAIMQHADALAAANVFRGELLQLRARLQQAFLDREADAKSIAQLLAQNAGLREQLGLDQAEAKPEATDVLKPVRPREGDYEPPHQVDHDHGAAELDEGAEGLPVGVVLPAAEVAEIREAAELASAIPRKPTA